MITASALIALALSAMGGAGVVTRDPTPSHPGVDVSCIPGAPVYATTTGYVRRYWDHHKGLTLIIHQPGQPSHSYSHLRSATREPWAITGQRIGSCGSTGAHSTGPHLHFEILQP